MLYAGVDAHKATSHITVVDEAGVVVRRLKVASSPGGIRTALGDLPGPVKAVVEASYTWGPVYDWLGEVADEVILAHPAKVRAIADARIKTDAIDSRTLAHLLRADLIPEAYAPSKEVRAIKRVLRQRMFLVRVQTMVKNRIHALLSQHAVTRPAVTDLFGTVGWKWLHALSLPDPDAALLREDLDLLETLRKQLKETKTRIKRLAADDMAIRWLISVPGIGIFLAVLIRYEVDDIARFREAKKFIGHTGLVPSTYASGLRQAHGRLTKQGNKWLRWAFAEAVTPAIRHSPSLRQYYDRIRTRRGVKDARVATARKLMELAWTVWTEQRCYVEQRPTQTTTNQGTKTAAALARAWA